MALKILTFLFFSLYSFAYAGNGSSGVGTARIARGFAASNLYGVVERVGDEIIDLRSKEKILNVVTINKNEMDINKLVKAKFGKVKGFEYAPNNIKENNYWVLCKEDEKNCYKLIPTSSTNRRIFSILGSLVEDEVQY